MLESCLPLIINGLKDYCDIHFYEDSGYISSRCYYTLECPCAKIMETKSYCSIQYLLDA